MKRIDFIAPVEAIRGNMSGRQVLQYAENDNPAFEAPDNKQNYARNYKPRFIGAKVAASGKVYFQVKTKSCSHKTARYRKQMSVMGGAGAIFASILRQKSSTLYANLETAYNNLPPEAVKPSFRKWIMDALIFALGTKSEHALLVSRETTITINNPWLEDTQTTGAQITDAIIGKFFEDLAVGVIEFKVNGEKGVAHADDLFADVVAGNYNTLGLSELSTGGETYVKMGGLFVMDGSNYAKSSDTIVAGKSYDLSAVEPSA